MITNSILQLMYTVRCVASWPITTCGATKHTSKNICTTTVDVAYSTLFDIILASMTLPGPYRLPHLLSFCVYNHRHGEGWTRNALAQNKSRNLLYIKPSYYGDHYHMSEIYSAKYVCKWHRSKANYDTLQLQTNNPNYKNSITIIEVQ